MSLATSESTLPSHHSGPEQEQVALSSDLGAEFDYRPVPILAPVSLVIGLLTLSTFITLNGVLIGLLGMLLSSICLWQIRRSEGEFGGRWLARCGLVSSVLFAVAGLGFQAYEYQQELPPGYQRVNFVRDISDKKFVVKNGQRELHPEVAPLDGEMIFIKGFMYQSKDLKDLKSFVLLKDNGECCFGGDPQPFDMIGVRMKDGMTVDSVAGLVSVGGRLTTHVDAAAGEPVYVLEADYFSRARTAF